jgi:hypothetical protein
MRETTEHTENTEKDRDEPASVFFCVFRGFFGLLGVFLWLHPLSAAEPVVRNVNLHGLQVGGTTTLVIDGDDLGSAPRLLLPFAAQQQFKKGTNEKQVSFDVTLGGDVVPGYYHLRVVTDGGVSAPVVIAVDRLPQWTLAPAVDALPAALHGALTGSTTIETKFMSKAGQKLLVEVEALRLGSKLRPIVHLYSPKRLQLAWAWTTPALHGDARLEATLPEEGMYTAAVHDAEYAGAAPGFFRLRLGQWSAADLVFPPVVAKGQRQTVELLGPAVAKLELPAPAGVGALPLPWPKEGVWSGPRPFVRVSSHAELLGQTAPDKVQALPPGPVGASGRLLTAFGEDRYRVPVVAGSKVRFEVFAERYGSPLDAALVVRNDKGDQLARAEDAPGTLDPVLEYAVPAGIKEVTVGVVDVQGRGGPRAIYRLAVEPHGAPGEADFRLLSPTTSVSLPAGGRWVVPVLIERKGYGGGVTLSAAGLPAGVKLDGATIPDEADGSLVTVQRGDAAGEAVITRWVGQAGGVEQPVVLKGSPMESVQPWLASEIAVAPTTAKAGDFQIDWGKLPSDAGPVPAKKLLLPVKLVRPATKDAVVKLTLLTSQVRPVVNGQLDPNQALRLEKPTEFGPKTNEGDLTVLVPPALPCPVYDVTVQAELLTPDKKTVLATAFAPVRRMTVKVPLVVKLDGPPRVEATVNPKTGGMVKIAGQVERKEGLTGDVTLTLTGLPPGVSAPPVVLKGGTTAFTLNVALPANQAAGEFKGLKLAATAPADPKAPNVVVRSRDVELSLVVMAAK